MHALRQQQTISEPVKVAGFGYWSGKDVTIEFRPAPVDSGIVFVRRDLESIFAYRTNALRRIFAVDFPLSPQPAA